MFRNELNVFNLSINQQQPYLEVAHLTKKLAQRAHITTPQLCFLKSNQVNAASDAHLTPQLIIITDGLIKKVSFIGILGAIAHEIGHLISLKNSNTQKKYHLQTTSFNHANVLVKSEFTADKIGAQLVGSQAVLSYLQQSKRALLYSYRHHMYENLNRFRIIPSSIKRLLIRRDKRVWYADDYYAPTLDPRINRLQKKF